MKIVSYNVNGLRPRVSQHGSLLKLLNSLDAHIICFQETKLSRQDLSVDLTMAEGYEAFVSCTRTSSKGRIGYSGVATFCRVNSAFSSNEVSLPVAAEEGFTGLLEHSNKKDAIKEDFLLEGLEEIKIEDLLKVDSEGRCIITDHGHFVLFNIYGPRAECDDKERVHFKLLFFKILQRRWESLLNRGRRVVVVGDLNIAPFAIDKCDAEPGFEDNWFRKWLRSLLRENGGPFLDVFRATHPRRKDAYTCFPQNVGGEQFNYGSRIDHILIAGPCLHQDANAESHNFLHCHVEECDILTKFKRGTSDNMPKWKGGRSIKLEGSDHIPVYFLLSDMPDIPLHDTPTLAVRYVHEVHGWQQTIVSLFMKRQIASGIEHRGASCSSFGEETRTSCSEFIGSGQTSGASEIESVPCASDFSFDKNIFTLKSEPRGCDSTLNVQVGGVIDETENNKFVHRRENVKVVPNCHMTLKKKVRLSCGSQRSITSFFQQTKDPSCTGADTSNVSTSYKKVDLLEEKYDSCCVTQGTNPSTITFHEGDDESSCQMIGSSKSPLGQDHGDINTLSSRRVRDDSALLEWQRIQQTMQNSLPLCNGHGEPCVARSVKKAGPNIGRSFYVCARAKGPASNREANCGYFKWASTKSAHKRR